MGGSWSYEDARKGKKPKICTSCYFWEGKGKGCGLSKCYYRQNAEGTEKTRRPKFVGNCMYCPYGKGMSCIGYCIAKILLDRQSQTEGGSGNG